MPMQLTNAQPKTKRKPCHRRGDPLVRDSEEAFGGFTLEVKWKELTGRFYDIALLFTSNPRSEMTKDGLLAMFDELWDFIPERIQLIAREDLPEKMLYHEPEESWKKEEK